MERLAGVLTDGVFKRDAGTVRKSEVIVLIGVQGTKNFVTNCGACGYATCEEFEKAPRVSGEGFVGPTCIFKALDLGIAIGSAVKTASILNADNRIMNTVGRAAKNLNYMPNATVIMGIPLSSSGKNPNFDRTWTV